METKRSYHRFTKKEDELILKNALNCPSNLVKSFEKSAKKLNLDFYSIRRRYYQHIAPKMYENPKSNKCFYTVSRKQVYPGYKNNKRGQYPTTRKPLNIFQTLWNTIIDSLKF